MQKYDPKDQKRFERGEQIMKKRIFIGSSLEAKELANSLREALRDEFECVLWYEGFFSLGNHFYTDLVQKIITFDYAIMIGGEDDLVRRISDKSEKISPRDNVYLEYGLFSGMLSPSKVLFLLHEECKVASDLMGMSISQYQSEEQAIMKARCWIEEHNDKKRRRGISRKDIGLMPTVGIAVGYYYNFIKPFVDKLTEADIDRELKLTVLVPTFVCDDVSLYSRNLIMQKKLKNDNIRNYRILVDPKEESFLHMYDVPNTILALFKTVNYIFGISDTNTEDTICAKQRALDDFYDNLQVLISNDYLVKSIVSLERLEE